MIFSAIILIILTVWSEQLRFKERRTLSTYEMQNILKERLFTRHGIAVETHPVEKMNESLRIYDADSSVILLSEALDYQNRTFQLAHILCFVELSDEMNEITSSAKIGLRINDQAVSC